MGSGWALFIGAPGQNEQHEHQALQLCVSGAGPLRATPTEGAPVVGHAIAIATRTSHAIDADGGPLALLYLEPEGEHGSVLSRALDPVGLLSAPEKATLPVRHAVASVEMSLLGPQEASRLREAIVALWLDSLSAPGSEATATDPRVAEARRIVRSRLSDGRISADDVARAVSLSPSRLAALFRKETGVPLRAFVLWARLQQAVEAVSAGRSLTEAALEAGFSDSAHLARTFRRMFGTTLTQGVGQLRIQVSGL